MLPFIKSQPHIIIDTDTCKNTLWWHMDLMIFMGEVKNKSIQNWLLHH